MIVLHVHRGDYVHRPVVRKKVAWSVDHDAVPLGLVDALSRRMGTSAAGHVKRILATNLPPRRVDRNHHVRLLAISSRDGSVTYIDCRVPDFLYVGKVGGGIGAMIPDRALNEHEEIEWMLMDRGGWSYPRAHEAAVIAENLVVRSMGFDPGSYQEVMRGLISFVEEAPVLSPPPDPYLTWEETQCMDDESCDCDHCKGGIHA